MNKRIIILKENPFSEVANELLDELTTDIATRYNFLMDGKGRFSPIENYGIYKENMHSNCFEKKLKND